MMRPRQARDSQYSAAPKVRRPPGSPTKAQLRAVAAKEAREHAAKWKTLIPVANAAWAKIHVGELATVKGDFHRLAGLVQMRYQLGREEADRQVKAFFGEHLPPLLPAAPIIAPPAVLSPVEAVSVVDAAPL